MKIKKIIIFTSLLLISVIQKMSAQSADTIVLNMQDVIRLAKDSSLTAFRCKNMYLANYWTFRNYKASLLPTLSLNLQPVSYNRQLIRRYDSYSDMDVYRQQLSFSTGGGLSLTQNFLPFGGRFYVNSSIDYLRYFGDNTFNQYSTVPFEIGYVNEILGFNSLKWQRKIEPLKFEQAQAEYIYNTEKISQMAVTYFFELAKALDSYSNAKIQAENSQALLMIGKRKFEIASISKADLQSLELDVLNAQNAILNYEIQVKRASMKLISYLGLPKDTNLSVIIPEKPQKVVVDVQKALEMMNQNNYLIKEKTNNVVSAEMNLDKMNKSTRFNASVSASVGFNQQAETLRDSYKDPMRRDVVSVSLTIPLMDWGTGRGSRNIAKNEKDIAVSELQQKIQELEQDVVITSGELMVRYSLMESSYEALKIAEEVYNSNIEKFKNASCDIAVLNSSQQRLQNAQVEYISAMSNYWDILYNLRAMTLYDFEKSEKIQEDFNFIK